MYQPAIQTVYMWYTSRELPNVYMYTIIINHSWFTSTFRDAADVNYRELLNGSVFGDKQH